MTNNRISVALLGLMAVTAGLAVTAVTADEVQSDDSKVKEMIRRLSVAKWQGEHASLMHCLTRCIASSWKIGHNKGREGVIDISIGDEPNAVKWLGHWKSVFSATDEKLVYINYDTGSPGGVAVCVDRISGKELWSTPIGRCFGQASYSLYFSERIVNISGSYVCVEGRETNGRFAGVLDLLSGSILAEQVILNK